MIRPELIKAIDAVTATTVSEPINIENAEKISLIFTRANHSAGSTAFSVEVSLDGVTYVAFSKLITNVTNTNAQTKTRVASVSLASNTSSIVAMDLENDIFRWMRITATETTDGTHTAKALIQRHA
jgi:hypothetical protein